MAEQLNLSLDVDLESGVTNTDGGSAAAEWASEAGLGGATGGAKITLTGANFAFVRWTFSTWSGNTAGRCRFYIDPNSLTMGNGEEFDCWRLLDASVGATAAVRLGYLTATGYYLKLRSIRDGGADDTATTVNITDAEHWVELHIVKESSDGADDGKYYWYIDSLSATVAEHLTVDNFNRFAGADAIDIGLITGRDAGTSGIFYGDELVVRNDATAIGGTNNSPTVTDISNQTGTFGTQKSVSCTIADIDSNITRCDVSTDGSCLITLTASGAASVTNNGTTAPYVTGTHTDVVATLGNAIKLDRAFSWTNTAEAPVWTDAETITVLVTDALSATGSDTFTMTWTIDTGDGKQSLELTNASISGINGELAASYYIPVTDFTGTDTLYVLVTDDNGNTDSALVTLNVTAPTAASIPQPAMSALTLGLHL